MPSSQTNSSVSAFTISRRPPIVKNPPEEEQIARLVDRIIQVGAAQGARFGREDVRVVKAPLRICPLGAHIDHQLGIVTGMTIDQSVMLAFAPATSESVYIESLNFPGEARFDLGHIPAQTKGDWANYVRGAVHALRQRHAVSRGMIGVVGGVMPIGGLSSSAAVTTAYLLAMEAINDLVVDAYENVELCRLTENGYIGLNNGILDQSVILFSAQGCLTRIDCKTVEIDQTPAPQDAAMDYEVMAVYSGVTHTLAGTDYNNRVAECQAAARQLLEADGRPLPVDVRLRHVSPEAFERYGGGLAEPLQRRARHFFGEMERVVCGIDAWQRGDLVEFGRLMTESGESSVKWYECGSPQLITLYDILREAPGVYGTRFSGAGFRGNCIALIDPAARESIAEAVHTRYPQAHLDEAARYSIHFCRPDGSVRLLTPAGGSNW
jgi:galactokinase/galacturonokinase